MTVPVAPAGWYPDPTGKGQRFWDGRAWAAAPAPIPPQRKAKSGKIVAGIVAGFVALIVIGSVGDDDKETAPSPSSSAESSFSSEPGAVPAAAPETAPTPVVPAGIGEEVRDGKFAFVVISVDRSAIAGDLSNQFMQEEAQGEFINVHMTITNVGDKAQTFFATNQKLVAAGRKYEADDLAAMWTDSANVEINPGNSITAIASFDVPPGTVAQTISLHDSMFSGGVDVRL